MTRVAKVLMEHVELADQIGEDDRAFAGDGSQATAIGWNKPVGTPGLVYCN